MRGSRRGFSPAIQICRVLQPLREIFTICSLRVPCSAESRPSARRRDQSEDGGKTFTGHHRWRYLSLVGIRIAAASTAPIRPWSACSNSSRAPSKKKNCSLFAHLSHEASPSGKHTCHPRQMRMIHGGPDIPLEPAPFSAGLSNRNIGMMGGVCDGPPKGSQQFSPTAAALRIHRINCDIDIDMEYVDRAGYEPSPAIWRTVHHRAGR